MDPTSKKRKPEENGAAAAAAAKITPEDARKIVEPFTQEQLLDIVATALSSGDPTVLDAVRAVADADPSKRKLFIRGLGWETTHDSLRSVFSAFGELEEAVVIADKATGRSKGYGFITYRHVDGAILALKEPSKKIDNRITVTQLASAGNTGAGGAAGAVAPAPDVALRKIYVGNVQPDMSCDSLLAHFSTYGEVEEGPLGFDKLTGKFRGYALFVFKAVEAAQACLANPTKLVDGHHLVCKLANTDAKKGKAGAPVTGAPQGQQGMPGAADIGLGGHSALAGSLPSQYGAPGGGLSGYPGYAAASALPSQLSHHHNLNSPLQSSLGMNTPGLQSSLGGAGAGGYGGGYGSSQYGGPGSGGYSGLGMGSSLYRMPPGAGGVPSGGYPESGQYPLSSSYQSQLHQPGGASPGRRYPASGFPGSNPFF